MLSDVDAARHQERLASARAAENSGDEAGAEFGFREVLDATRGSGALVAWIALANLTGLYMRQGRESECLILVRRVIDGAAGFEPFRRVWALQALCMALSNLGEWGRLEDELPRFEAAIPDCPDPYRTVFGRSSRALRATIALECGSVDDARAANAALEASLDGTAAPNTSRFVHLIGADIELRARRLPEAMAAARRARPFAASPVEAVAGVVVEAECLLELEGPDAARRVVREVLDEIDATPVAPRAPALLLKSGPRLAELVQERCGDDDLARRTFDLAGIAMVQRVIEIERAVTGLPELADPHPADQASLAAFRARFAADMGRFLAAVARVLGERSCGGAFLRPGGRDFLRVCAWCVRLHGADGSWLPVGHLLAGADYRTVTHGMCDTCELTARAGLPGARV